MQNEHMQNQHNLYNQLLISTNKGSTSVSKTQSDTVPPSACWDCSTHSIQAWPSRFTGTCEALLMLATSSSSLRARLLISILSEYSCLAPNSELFTVKRMTRTKEPRRRASLICHLQQGPCLSGPLRVWGGLKAGQKYWMKSDKLVPHFLQKIPHYKFWLVFFCYFKHKNRVFKTGCILYWYHIGYLSG